MISSAVGRRALLLVQLPLVGVLRERDHAVGDRVAGGLVARHREHDHEEAELVVGELLAVDVGLDERRDDVVGRVLAPLLGHRHRVHDQFHRRLRRVDVGELGILAAGHLVGPAEQLVAVVLRDAEQSGDGLQRQLTATPARRSRRRPRPRPSWRCSARAARAPPPAGRWRAGVKPREMILRSRVWCGASMLSMTLRCSSIVLARHLLRPGRDGAVLPAGEDVAAPRHLLDVGVLGDQPVALVVEAAGAAGHVDPVDGLGLAQLGELLDGQTRRG